MIIKLFEWYEFGHGELWAEPGNAIKGISHSLMSQLKHSNKHYCLRLMLHSGQKARTEIHYNYPIPQHTHMLTQRSDCDMMQSIPLWMKSVFVHLNLSGKLKWLRV